MVLTSTRLPRILAKRIRGARIRSFVAGLLIVILTLPIAGSVLAVTVDELEDQIKEKQAQITKLQKEADTYKKTIGQQQEYASGIQAQISNFNAQIGQLESQGNPTKTTI